MAFSAKLPVNVQIAQATETHCGIVATMVGNTKDNYIKIRKKLKPD